MPNITIPPSVKEALRPLMTRKIAYGAAISLAAGIGLGAWLQPPSFHYGSTGTTIVTPPAQTDPWSADVSSASTLPYNQPESSPSAFQMAAVSPPEPRWTPQPEQRPSMQDRHWDFRPDGSAVPLDDGGG